MNGMCRIPFSTSFISPSKRIVLGHRVQFGPHCDIHCDVEIGSHVLLAPRVAIIGRNDHRIDLVGYSVWTSPRGEVNTTVIEDDVWIGYGAIILSGVRISHGAIVAAGAVVTRNVNPYEIVAGNPAKVLRLRIPSESWANHEATWHMHYY